MSENYSIVTDVNAGNSMAVLDQIINKIQQVDSAISKAGGQPLNINTDSASQGLSSFLNAEKGKFGNVGKEMGQSLQMGMQQQFGMAGGMATSFASALGPIGIAAGAAAVGVGVLAAASVNLAKDWQTMMAGVSKTTGVEGAELDALGSKLQEIRMQTGATAESITSAVVTAGSIGIPTNELAEFAQVALQMGSAFSMSSDEAASGIAAIGNSVKPASESWTEFANKAGSSINVLADTMRTSETQIITGMKHLSGTFGLLKPPEDTIPAWQALVATIQSLGLEGDSAGESLKDAATYITRNEKNKISDLLGITGEQLQLDVRSNAPELFQRIALAISNLPLEQQGEALKAFGQSGAQGIGMLMGDIDKTTGGFTKLGAAIKTSEGAWKDATSLSAAYGKSQATLDASLSKLTASLAVAGTKLGTVMLPAITAIVDALTFGVIAATQFGESIYGLASGAGAAISAAAGGGSLADVDKAFLGAMGIETTTEISAAEMGKQTASVYTDYVNQGIQAGNFDPITGKMKAVGAEAGKAAGDVFGEGFIQKLKDSKVSEQMGALLYDAAGNMQMSDTEALGILGSQQSSDDKAKTTILAKTAYALLENYSLQKLQRKTDEGGLLQIANSSGSIIKAESYTSDAELRKLTNSLEDAIEPSFLDMPKYMKGVAGEMSSTLEGILSDGVVEFTEKGQLEEYIKSLDALQVQSPVEFEAKGLTKIRDDLVKTAAGIPITLDTGEAEANFEVWLLEKADIFEAQWKNTGVMPLREEQRKRWEFEQTATPAQMKYLAGLDKAITSDEPGAVSGAKTYAKALLDSEPTLKKTTWATQELGSVQVETNQHFTVLNGTLVALDEAGQPLPGIFADTAVVLPALGQGILDLLVSVESAAARFNGIMLSGGNQQWTQSRISDNAFNNAYTGNIGTSLASTTGFNVAKVATESDFGGLLSGKLGMNIPKLGQVSKISAQTGGGLAFLGEKGEDEWVIPVSAIKGLWPQSAKVDMGSINYKPFLDYPAPEIRAPTSYRWSQYPNAPNVAEKNTDAIQTAWLSDKQLNSRDIYSGLLRDMQLASIGKSQVIPWFARGDLKQPSWWTEAATSLSPQHAANWAANKGGTVPSIGKDVADSSSVATVATKNGITVADAWSQLYGESFTEGCISTNAPDASLKFTPSASLVSEIGRTWGSDATAAWNQLYGEAFTEGCIGTNKPDALLKYTPSASMLEEAARAQGGAWGSQSVRSIGGSGGSVKAVKLLGDIEKNTAASDERLAQSVNILANGIFETQGSLKNFPSIGGGGQALVVTGLSKEGYLATYDPRTDTCEGLSFVAPDASLKTTDKFYLGLTQNSPYRSEDKAAGYGWSNVAQPMNEADAQLMKISEQSYKEQQQTSKETAKVEKNTRELSADMKASMAGKGYDSSGALVAMGGGGGGSMLWNGQQNWGAGSFGGTSVSGMGGWVGTGATQSGWGAQASSGKSGSFGGSSGWGSVQWAKGGIYDDPMYFMDGNGNPNIAFEAGREAFVPISDRAAGRRILPQVMRELGVRQFARGGFAGSGGSISTAIGPSIGNITVINQGDRPVDEARLAREIIAKIAKKDVLARKRRG